MDVTTVYKYTVCSQTTSFPVKGYLSVLCAKIQGESIVIYCLVDKGLEDSTSIEADVRMTGDTRHIPSGEGHKQYLNTLMMPNGIVAHVFYKEHNL
tara:strand:+ start:1736 stop:2023 length:288 start_codon:yes stop_codon:yes gene_type:complete